MTENAGDARTEAEADQDSHLTHAEEVARALDEYIDDAEEFEARYQQQVAAPDYVSRLTAAAALLLEEPEEFTSGELVTWKPGLHNRFFPAEGAPAVVVGVSPGSASTEEDPSSALFNEPLDLQLGIIDGDGDFIVFSYDRRRFTHWRASDEAAPADD